MPTQHSPPPTTVGSDSTERTGDTVQHQEYRAPTKTMGSDNSETSLIGRIKEMKASEQPREGASGGPTSGYGTNTYIQPARMRAPEETYNFGQAPKDLGAIKKTTGPKGYDVGGHNWENTNKGESSMMAQTHLDPSRTSYRNSHDELQEPETYEQEYRQLKDSHARTEALMRNIEQKALTVQSEGSTYGTQEKAVTLTYNIDNILTAIHDMKQMIEDTITTTETPTPYITTVEGEIKLYISIITRILRIIKTKVPQSWTRQELPNEDLNECRKYVGILITHINIAHPRPTPTNNKQGEYQPPRDTSRHRTSWRSPETKRYRSRSYSEEDEYRKDKKDSARPRSTAYPGEDVHNDYPRQRSQGRRCHSREGQRYQPYRDGSAYKRNTNRMDTEYENMTRRRDQDAPNRTQRPQRKGRRYGERYFFDPDYAQRKYESTDTDNTSDDDEMTDSDVDDSTQHHMDKMNQPKWFNKEYKPDYMKKPSEENCPPAIYEKIKMAYRTMRQENITNIEAHKNLLKTRKTNLEVTLALLLTRKDPNLRNTIKQVEDMIEQVSIYQAKRRRPQQDMEDFTTPKVGHNDDFSKDDLYKHTRMNKSSKLTDIWHNASKFAETELLSNEGFKTVLSIVLNGDAARILTRHEHKSPKFIARKLQVIYGENKLALARTFLKTLQRDKMESISSCMARAEPHMRTLAEREQYQDRKTKVNELMRTTMKTIASTPAWNKVETDIEEYRQNNFPITPQVIMHKLETYEDQAKYIHSESTDAKININKVDIDTNRDKLDSMRTNRLEECIMKINNLALGPLNTNPGAKSQNTGDHNRDVYRRQKTRDQTDDYMDRRRKTPSRDRDRMDHDGKEKEGRGSMRNPRSFQRTTPYSRPTSSNPDSRFPSRDRSTSTFREARDKAREEHIKLAKREDRPKDTRTDERSTNRPRDDYRRGRSESDTRDRHTERRNNYGDRRSESTDRGRSYSNSWQPRREWNDRPRFQTRDPTQRTFQQQPQYNQNRPRIQDSSQDRGSNYRGYGNRDNQRTRQASLTPNRYVNTDRSYRNYGGYEGQERRSRRDNYENTRNSYNQNEYRNSSQGGYRNSSQGGYRNNSQGGYRSNNQGGYRNSSQGGNQNQGYSGSNYYYPQNRNNRVGSQPPREQIFKIMTQCCTSHPPNTTQRAEPAYVSIDTRTPSQDRGGNNATQQRYGNNRNWNPPNQQRTQQGRNQSQTRSTQGQEYNTQQQQQMQQPQQNTQQATNYPNM